MVKLACSKPQEVLGVCAHGWTAEDMEENVAEVKQSEELRNGMRAPVERAVETAGMLLKQKASSNTIVRGGRKARWKSRPPLPPSRAL